MRKNVVIEQVSIDAGDYWLGDPCYVIRDDEWIPWLEECRYTTQTNLVGKIPGTGFVACGLSTAFGDGEYPYFVDGDEVFSLPVDAGMIGFVPVEYGSPKYPELVTKVSFDGWTSVTWENGNISWWGEGGVNEVKTD